MINLLSCRGKLLLSIVPMLDCRQTGYHFPVTLHAYRVDLASSASASFLAVCITLKIVSLNRTYRHAFPRQGSIRVSHLMT